MSTANTEMFGQQGKSLAQARTQFRKKGSSFGVFGIVVVGAGAFAVYSRMSGPGSTILSIPALEVSDRP